MEELQDAIEDAQYMNAINDDSPKPTREWSWPSPEELKEYTDKQLAANPKAFEAEGFCKVGCLGFYLVRVVLLHVMCPNTSPVFPPHARAFGSSSPPSCRYFHPVHAFLQGAGSRLDGLEGLRRVLGGRGDVSVRCSDDQRRRSDEKHSQRLHRDRLDRSAAGLAAETTNSKHRTERAVAVCTEIFDTYQSRSKHQIRRLH